MNRRANNCSIPIRIGRAILGGALLLTLLAGSFPLSTLASGPMCELACCAGRAPHAAGSCMNGSCHAFASAHSKNNHDHEVTPEHLCGLSKLRVSAGRIASIATVTFDPSTRKSQSSSSASVATTAMTRPCQPDCGGLLSRSTGSKRQRDEAALAYANRPRPPSRIKPRANDYNLTRTLAARARRGAPRGPPFSS